MLTNIPNGFQTRYFRETEGNSLPTITTNCAMLLVPCFIRQFTRDDGTTGYKWIYAIIVPTGVDTSDYDTFIEKSWSFLRKYFYSTPEAQSEMRDDDVWEAHRQAVRSAFPKYSGEVNTAVIRYGDIKDEFWQKIDEILASVEKTRDKLPAMPFDDRAMFAWAEQNSVPEDLVKSAEEVFVRVAINLGVIKRNWNELFIDIPD